MAAACRTWAAWATWATERLTEAAGKALARERVELAVPEQLPFEPPTGGVATSGLGGGWIEGGRQSP